MRDVRVRYISGDEIVLKDCRTVRDIKVKIAIRLARFAPDVMVLTENGEAVTENEVDLPPVHKLSGTNAPVERPEEEHLPENVNVVIQDLPKNDRYPWMDAILTHAMFEDASSVSQIVQMLRMGNPFATRTPNLVIHKAPAMRGTIRPLAADDDDDGNSTTSPRSLNSNTLTFLNPLYHLFPPLLPFGETTSVFPLSSNASEMEDDESTRAGVTAEDGLGPLFSQVSSFRTGEGNDEESPRIAHGQAVNDVSEPANIPLLAVRNDKQPLLVRADISNASSYVTELNDESLGITAGNVIIKAENNNAAKHTPLAVPEQPLLVRANISDASSSSDASAHRGIPEDEQMQETHGTEGGEYNNTRPEIVVQETNNTPPLLVRRDISRLSELSGPSIADLLLSRALMKYMRSEGTRCKDAVIGLLCSAGADVNYADERGMTPLIHATRAGNPEVVEALINAKADVDHANEQGWTALLEATYAGNADVVRVLTHKGRANVNVVNSNRWSPAIYGAARLNRVNEVSILIEAGADVNLANVNGARPLYDAARCGFSDVVAVLLSAGAEVDAGNNTETTALLEAAYACHDEVVSQLIAAGADVNKTNGNGWTALLEACRSQRSGATESSVRIVEALIAAGADVNLADRDGWTPLYEASRLDNPAIIRPLIEAGANVNHKDKDGNSALIEASYWGFHEVVSLLLEGRADVNQRDDQGFSCLLLASSSKHHEVVELLLAAGTDENEKKNAETTLLRMPNGIGMKQRTNCSWKL